MGNSNGWIKLQLLSQTMVLVGPKTLHNSGTADRSSQVRCVLSTLMRFQANVAQRYQHLLCICSLSGNYEGKWETANCFKSHGFICEMTGGQTPKPTSAPGESKCWSCITCCLVRGVSLTFSLFASDSHCDHGYLLYKDHCYYFETETAKNWIDAEARCVSEQGHLVSFQSQEELSFLTCEWETKQLSLKWHDKW